MLNALQTLSVFGLIWVMTRGGPGGKSQTLPQAFQNSVSDQLSDPESD
jgi:multiple sugar transport system permease protein